MLGKQPIRSAVLGILITLALLSANVGAGAAATSSSGGSGAKGAFRCDPAVAFDSGNFSNPTAINNQFTPLMPGTQFVLDGVADVGNGVQPHHLVLTVTDLTKVIDGVRTRVTWEVDTNGGQLVETELAFVAQDDEGNVWNLGEYPEEFENGLFAGASNTWISGLSDAEGGIRMMASPQRGTPWYLQGSVPSIEFLDCGKVRRTLSRRCVPAGCYQDVLVILEDTPLEPGGGYQRKYYAPGVGNIQVNAVGDPEGETLDLIQIGQLSAEELALARQEALALDARGCQFSAVYCDTSPAEGSP